MNKNWLQPGRVLALGLFLAGLKMIIPSLPNVMSVVAGVLIFISAIWVLFVKKAEF